MPRRQQTSAGTPARTSISFMKLPPELRNRIYRLVLPADTTIELGSKAAAEHNALLRTTSQIRQEASDIFYAGNKFLITISPFNAARMARRIQVAGRRNLGVIPSLTIRVGFCARKKLEMDELRHHVADADRGTFAANLVTYFKIVRVWTEKLGETMIGELAAVGIRPVVMGTHKSSKSWTLVLEVQYFFTQRAMTSWVSTVKVGMKRVIARAKRSDLKAKSKQPE
ncbi:hypothetical protein BAUCODRAFT_206166 [Baudoinia panamericana UAMH 10762]|uniref:2EXR domain-containing protein n=1 Tax=Baudoinia panamericana (strain UAMH 10762) TaxID=717646 RepID=M2LHV1_BAUPA|nr:uncharacterized protein BAUCODRAFT_206166 [Baudoinia panamericana UAMH 10762]EMC93757.1 hypothetical protein BAUCODRAFT_206166 [Baudoinia panamericana UAMH 10762]